MTKPKKLCSLVQEMMNNLPSRSVTVKVRTGWDDKHPTTHELVPQLQNIGMSNQMSANQSEDGVEVCRSLYEERSMTRIRSYHDTKA
jgi:hypothetical protein